MRTMHALALSILLSAPLFAKGNLVRIVIKGPSLPSAIEINDPAIKDFTIWAGPGVTINSVKQTDGFIIDWAQGPLAAHPTGLPRYEVSFYAKLHGSPQETLVHVVSYEYDPLTQRGYVYLPGKADPQYKLNTTFMFHDNLEGNWFRATSAWQSFSGPILAKANAAR